MIWVITKDSLLCGKEDKNTIGINITLQYPSVYISHVLKLWMHGMHSQPMLPCPSMHLFMGMCLASENSCIQWLLNVCLLKFLHYVATRPSSRPWLCDHKKHKVHALVVEGYCSQGKNTHCLIPCLLIECSLYQILTEALKSPKWKRIYKSAKKVSTP